MFGYDWPRLHAALNDLPAALLLVAVLFDLASALLRRPALRVAGFWTLLAGAVGAILAVMSGLQAEEHIAHGEAVHQVMETHEKLALDYTGNLRGAGALADRAGNPDGRHRARDRPGAVGRGHRDALATAVYGGKLVFDHAAGIPTEVLQAEMHERSEGHHHHGGAEGDADEAAEHAAPDAAVPAPAADSTTPGGHTHAPGTPPHKD